MNRSSIGEPDTIFELCQTAVQLNDRGARLLQAENYEMARGMFREGIEIVKEVDTYDLTHSNTKRKNITELASTCMHYSSKEDAHLQECMSSNISSGSSSSHDDLPHKEEDNHVNDASNQEDDASTSHSRPTGGGTSELSRTMSLEFLSAPGIVDDLHKCASFISETVSAALIFNLALAHDLHAKKTESEICAQQALDLYSLAKSSLSGDEFIAIRNFRDICCAEDLIECRQRLLEAALHNSFIIYCDYGEHESAGKIHADLMAVNSVMRMQGFHYGGFTACYS